MSAYEERVLVCLCGKRAQVGHSDGWVLVSRDMNVIYIDNASISGTRGYDCCGRTCALKKVGQLFDKSFFEQPAKDAEVIHRAPTEGKAE